MKLSWFKKKQRPLPNDTTCRNCGKQTIGRYCHECGQDLFAGIGVPFFTLIGNFLSHALALNNKTPITLAFLLVRPGFLSAEYRLGRIKKYVHPVSLFWISTLVFFTLLISRADFGNNEKNQSDADVIATEQTTIDVISDSVTKQTVVQSFDAIPDTTATKKPPKKNKTIVINNNEVENWDSEKIRRYLSKFAPYATFLFIPVFALLLMLFFWRSRFYYIYHMVFAMHFHSFLWIYSTLFWVLFWVFPNLEFPDWLSFLVFLVPGIYLSIAFYRFYLNQTKWKVIWKSIIITFFYFLMILFGTAGLILLALKLAGVI